MLSSGRFVWQGPRGAACFPPRWRKWIIHSVNAVAAAADWPSGGCRGTRIQHQPSAPQSQKERFFCDISSRQISRQTFCEIQIVLSMHLQQQKSSTSLTFSLVGLSQGGKIGDLASLWFLAGSTTRVNVAFHNTLLQSDQIMWPTSDQIPLSGEISKAPVVWCS